MPGFHADPDGNIYEQARQKVASTAVFLAKTKRLPGADGMAIAYSIVRFMEPRALYAFVHASDAGVTEDVQCRIVELLDYQAAHAMLALFAHVGGVRLDLLPHHMVGSLADKILHRVRDGAPDGAITYVWPTLQIVEQWAHERLAKERCAEKQSADLAMIEAAMLSLIQERT